MNPRHLIIRFVLPVVWRFSPKRKVMALQEFSMTEMDSGWQSLYAMNFVSDPGIRAMLFEHGMEEFFHRDMFASLLRSRSDSQLSQPVFTREVILQSGDPKEALLKFFAFVHVGESEVNKDFQAYSTAAIDDDIGQVFRNIMRDEVVHEADFKSLLLSLTGGNRAIVRWTIFRFRFKRAFAHYTKFMKKVGEIPMSILLSAIYFLVGPFALASLRNRLALSADKQLEIVQAQAQELQNQIRSELARSRSA